MPWTDNCLFVYIKHSRDKKGNLTNRNCFVWEYFLSVKAAQPSAPCILNIAALETWIGRLLLLLLQFLYRDSEWATRWVAEWARIPASPPVCSCCPAYAPPISHRTSLAAAATVVSNYFSQDWRSVILNGEGHLEWLSWPRISHTVSLILYLELGPNGSGIKSW